MPPADQQISVLEEITVTATRRAELIQSVLVVVRAAFKQVERDGFTKDVGPGLGFSDVCAPSAFGCFGPRSAEELQLQSEALDGELKYDLGVFYSNAKPEGLQATGSFNVRSSR
jgi:hypothetical protein